MDDLTLDADLEHHLFKTNSRESRPICAAAYKLHPLIGVEDLRMVLLQRPLERLETEPTVERIRELPGQHVTAEPIDDRNQVHEAMGHPHVGHVRTPHLIRVCDRQTTQEIRINLGLRGALARLGLGINGGQAIKRISRCTRL